MKRLDTRFLRSRRAWLGVGVVVLGVVAGGVLIGIASSRPDRGTAAATPSASPVDVASATLSPTAMPETSSPTPVQTETAAPNVAVAPSASAEPAWKPTAIEGMSTVMGIVERNGRLVATGHDGEVGAIATSDDGQTWQPVELSTAGPLAFYTVVPGETGFIAVATRYPIPMGMPVYEYLYSTDARTWMTAEPPAECVTAAIVAHGSGFLGIGSPCQTEVPQPSAPGSLRVLESPDGRTWTSRRDEVLRPGPWAIADGRIVLLQEGDDPAGGFVHAWISDDAARTWRQSAAQFPEGFYPSSVFHGHDRYVVPGSWKTGAGDSESAVCTSRDGDAWECEAIAEPASDMAGRNWLGRQVAVTPTGFASLVEYVNDPAYGGDGSTDMVLATSRDGLVWEFTAVPELKNRLPNGLTWTSHGLFSWGGLSRNVTPDAYVPYLVRHDATLP
jgi:hypothetical protein